jgi:modulator of FtsH protease
MRTQGSVIATNRVLRNTYLLLSMTLLFSAAMAGVSYAMALPPTVAMISSLAAIGLIWLALPRTENSGKGIAVVFAITGLLGLGLGPMLNVYLAIPEGPRIVATALGGTGLIFLGLSGYALVSGRNFEFLGGMLFAGLIVVLVAAIANIFLHMPLLQLTVSAGIILVMSGLILFDTSRIVHGGETNYIRATVSLYLSIYNIFVALLQILTAFSGDD